MSNPIDTRDSNIKLKQITKDNTSLVTASDAILADMSALGAAGYTKNAGADALEDSIEFQDIQTQMNIIANGLAAVTNA